MTSEQRAIVEYTRDAAYLPEQIAALTAALGTCGNCQHSNPDDSVLFDATFCTNADSFYHGLEMQKTARCADWRGVVTEDGPA